MRSGRDVLSMVGAGFSAAALVGVVALVGTASTSAEPSGSAEPSRTTCDRPARPVVEGNGLFRVSAAGEVVRLRPRADDERHGAGQWSPDGRYLAVIVVRPDAPGRLVVVDADSGTELHPLGDRPVGKVVWGSTTRLVVETDRPASPDQPWRQQLVAVDIDGGRLTTLWEDPGRQMLILLAPSPDGRRIFFVGDEAGGKLMVVNLDGSGFRRIADDAYWDDTTPAVAPDGRHVAAVLGGVRTIIDADSGEQVQLGPASHSRVITGPIGGHLGTTPQEAVLGWSPTGTEVAWRAGDSGEVLFYRSDGSPFTVVDDKISGWAQFVADGRILFLMWNDDASRLDLEVIRPDGSGRRTLVSQPYNWAAFGNGVVFEAPRGSVDEPAVLCWVPFDRGKPGALAAFRTLDTLAAGPYVAVTQ